MPRARNVSSAAEPSAMRCCKLFAFRRSCLLFPVMADTDAIVMTGVEQTAQYTGYGRSLRFAGAFADSSVLFPESTAAAENGDGSMSMGSSPALACRGACVVAIDAVRFHPDSFALQLSPGLLYRELFKALAGFGTSGWESSSAVCASIATGKWGCGVFNGCNTIKLLLQWVAASRCGREVLFYVFDGLPGGLQQLVFDIEAARLNGADVWLALLEMHRDAAVKDEQTLLQQMRQRILEQREGTKADEDV